MMNRRQFIEVSAGALATWSLWGCAGEGITSSQGGNVVVFRNGVVLPVDQSFSEHDAIALQGNRILAVGSDDAVMAAAGSGARIIDLDGRVVMPGFMEPHMHFVLMAGVPARFHLC